MWRLQMCGVDWPPSSFSKVVKYLLEGGSVPEHFAESRTVFIPKTSDIDDNGRIIRSPDALRPLTLCSCNCKLLYFCHLSRPPFVHREMHTPFAEMYLFQADDGQHL